jgi:methylmalonyl-CoA/ethylmalonyl-CoA epimerase
MALKRIDHIGVAVEDAAQVARLFCELLGTDPAGEDSLAAEGLEVVSVAAGGDHIEFFTPTNPEHTVRRFLDRRGGNALHHICIEVDDLDHELSRLERLGVALVDKKPRPGAHGRRVAFLHPKSTGGLLIELSERASAGPSDLAP